MFLRSLTRCVRRFSARSLLDLPSTNIPSHRLRSFRIRPAQSIANADLPALDVIEGKQEHIVIFGSRWAGLLLHTLVPRSCLLPERHPKKDLGVLRNYFVIYHE